MKKTKFDDFVRLNRGFDLPDSQVIEGKYPVVASTNIKTYHSEYRIEPPVVVTGRSGSLGKVQYITEKCWPLNTSLYSKDFRGNYPLYVYYYLQLMHLEQYNAGAGVPTLNQNHLHGLKLLVHDKTEQKKVADVLYEYNRAIENNNKRIKILEQITENLYREWFVRFRFPGHEVFGFESGVPKIFEYKKFSEICSYIRGASYSADQIDNESFSDYLINLKNLRDYGGFRKENYKLYGGEYKTEQIVNRFDLVMAITEMVQERRIIGYTGLVPSYNNKCVISADLIKIQSDYNSLFLYSLFTYGGGSKCFSQYGNGTNVIHLRPSSISNVKLLVPDIHLANEYVELVRPLFDEIDNLQLQNEKMTKQRDLLLPRLMSGKLQVK